MPFSDITGFSGEREIFDQSVGASGAGSYMRPLWNRARPDLKILFPDMQIWE